MSVKKPEVRPSADRRELEIWDPIERSSVGFGFPEPVSVRSSDPELFHFPVDHAVCVETGAIEFDSLQDVHIWTADGEFVAETTNGSPVELQQDTYLIDCSEGIKTYLRVDSSVAVLSDFFSTTIEFDPQTQLHIGYRSMHDHPAAEIQVQADPYSVMDAVSYFGSALKTLSPERSYPTLRGHPPTISIGETTEVPPALSRPDSGIQLHCPPEYRYVFPATSLAYYLGATMVPSSDARLVGPGWEHNLGTTGRPETYDSAVARTLQHVFFFDCLARTEGYYQMQLHERSEFEKRYSLDWKHLYDLPIGDRVGQYLEIPFEDIVDLVPEWRLTTDIQPDTEYVEALPYLAGDLAAIRCPELGPTKTVKSSPESVDDFLRDAGAIDTPRTAFVDVPDAASVEHTWVGDADPIKVGKTTVDSFKSRLSRELERDGDLEIAVAVNDDAMNTERERLEEVFEGLQGEHVSIEIIENLSTDAFRKLLYSDVDFVHYVGHVTPDGILCSDGLFDARDHKGYSVDAFILNGCASYTQGHALVDGGCVGGVVTTSEVLNGPAVEIGAKFIRLLLDGFSLRSAIDIARQERLVGNQYMVIGEGNLQLAEETNVTPFVCEVIDSPDDMFEVTIETYPTQKSDMGTIFTPHIPQVNQRYLSSGYIDTISASKDDLYAFFTPTSIPIVYEGKLMWSDEFVSLL